MDITLPGFFATVLIRLLTLPVVLLKFLLLFIFRPPTWLQFFNISLWKYWKYLLIWPYWWQGPKLFA